MISFYCLHRINDHKIKSLNNDISAILWLCSMLGHSVAWKNNSDFIEVKAILHKLFFVPPDKAEPVYPSMIKKWLIKINVNVNNAYKIPFGLLLKVTIMTIYSMTGMRTMELLMYPKKNAKNGIKFRNIKIIRYRYKNKYNHKINSIKNKINYILLTIDPDQYKNAKFRKISKDYVIGDSFDDIYNPYKYLLIYLKRLKKLSLNNNKIKINQKDIVFRFENGDILKTHIPQNWLKEILVTINIDINDGKKHSLHGIRAGIATWLRNMKVPIEQICNFIGWSDKWLSSASFGYFRFTNEQKADLAKKIAEFKPEKPLSLICG